ncbi:helix-turn-helix domain-containing protein [Nocardioides sp. MAHUQ-72]|uniref:helix-turn-helix domain-containing protein n=1 Tax=unclassified Nocardioides TaxID=2615069 RepID=UPI0036090C7B
MSESELPERVRMHRALEVPGLRGVPDGRVVSDRLLASWQRSQDYGVPLESVEPVFTGTYDEESLFFECGREVLTDLHRTLVNEPISLMLTDADGLVLNRLSGDTSLLRALDAVHLAPGFAYSERAAGTNGLGLALADRVPTVVRAEEHYSLSLCTYTCAAVPVLDPLTGRLEGSVNLTTWSKSSSDLLLALAQSAAGNTTALMLARSRGQRPRPAPRGEVFRVETEPGSGTLQELSPTWLDAVARAEQAMVAGRVVAAVGEPGAGRGTMLAQAQRHALPRDRILSASSPAAQDIEPWLSLWSPELGKPNTAVVVCDVDALPVWAAERLRELVVRAQASVPCLPFSITAERFEDIPAPLAGLVGTVVQVPPLRERLDDILPLARHAARRVRGRDVDITPAAVQALASCGWPGNVDQLNRVVRDAAARTDVIDVRHLPSEVLSGTAHRLTRIEAFEREEIVRVLTRPGVTMKEAAEELGMSRATIYRKVAQYDIHIPKG